MKNPIRFIQAVMLLLLTLLWGCEEKNEYLGTAKFTFASKDHQLDIKIYSEADNQLFQLYSNGEEQNIDLNMNQYRIYVESSNYSCSSPKLYIQVRPGKTVNVVFTDELAATIYYE